MCDIPALIATNRLSVVAVNFIVLFAFDFYFLDYELNDFKSVRNSSAVFASAAFINDVSYHFESILNN